MASRGGMVPGTTGADYEHREQIAEHYKLSALYKSRLRWTIFFQLLLVMVLALKLSVDVLDRLDIFILELEELRIPQPHWWEWWYCVLGVCPAVLTLPALRRNYARGVRRGAVAALGTAPALLAGAAHAVALRGGEQQWQGYSVSLVWACWLTPAVQVLGFQLLFARRLLQAWRRPRGKVH